MTGFAALLQHSISRHFWISTFDSLLFNLHFHKHGRTPADAQPIWKIGVGFFLQGCSSFLGDGAVRDAEFRFSWTNISDATGTAHSLRVRNEVVDSSVVSVN